MSIEKHLNLLGKRVKDKVTGASGVVTSVSFDLFGCVQAIIDMGFQEDKKERIAHWFDVSRLAVMSDRPVMDPPYYLGNTPQAAGLQGAAEKPLR